MKFLDTTNVCVKQRRAKLLLDFYELMHQSDNGKATLAQFNEVRGHENWDAARQDLTRYRKALADYGVKLGFGHNEDNVFELDLRSLRALVTREITEATNFLQSRKIVPGNGALSHDDDINASGSCLNCGETSRVPLEDLVSQRSHEAFVTPMRDLRREYHVGHARLKRVLKAKRLERRQGRQPVETLRPKDDVAKAITVARSKGAFKVKVLELAELLDCSARTAARFIERVRGGRISSSHR